MGKKAGELHINAKKFGGLAKPCMKDMITFLGCLSLNHNSDEKCTRQRQLLDTCLESQVIILYEQYTPTIELHI